MFDYEKLYPNVLVAMFPDPRIRQQAKTILYRYGSEDTDKEPVRVRLALLKLAGRDLEALKINVSYALTDYRDVLAWAEYPNAVKSDSWRLPDGSPEKKRINDADQDQYQEWLDTLFPQGETDHGT